MMRKVSLMLLTVSIVIAFTAFIRSAAQSQDHKHHCEWVAHVNLASVLIHKKMYGQALTELTKAREQSGGNTQTIALTGYVLALSGERGRARGVLEELGRLSGQRYVPPYNMAIVHHGLGEREEALSWLEKAFEGRDVLLTFAAVDPKWDALRSDQRFVSLLERMKLPK